MGILHQLRADAIRQNAFEHVLMLAQSFWTSHVQAVLRDQVLQENQESQLLPSEQSAPALRVLLHKCHRLASEVLQTGLICVRGPKVEFLLRWLCARFFVLSSLLVTPSFQVSVDFANDRLCSLHVPLRHSGANTLVRAWKAEFGLKVLNPIIRSRAVPTPWQSKNLELMLLVSPTVPLDSTQSQIWLLHSLCH